jgi:hypothetical protein
MKQLSFILVLVLFLSLNVSAQTDTVRNYEAQRGGGFSWDNAFTGGSFGLTLGTITDIQLDPEFGYRFGNYLYLGVGFDYEYFNETYSYPSYSYTSQFIGGNIFARYVVYRSIFAETQFRETNWNEPVPDFATGYYTLTNVTVPAFNVGAGYMQQVGRKSAFYIVALYDLLYSNNSPSASPFAIQVGFDFGL